MPTNKLEILPVKTMENRNAKEIPPPLLQPPFLWIIVGSVRSGKSVMLMNLLMNKNFGYNDYFDNIIFLSPTLPSDKTGQILYKDEDIIKITDGLDISMKSCKSLSRSKKTATKNCWWSWMTFWVYLAPTNPSFLPFARATDTTT